MNYKFVKPDPVTKRIYSITVIFTIIGLLGWFKVIPLTEKASLLYLLIAGVLLTISALINIYKNIKQFQESQDDQ